MITITGLGPGDFDRIPSQVRSVLVDPSVTVVARTRHHPAAQELEKLRAVVFCDDLYESFETFDEVYDAIVGRVIEAARRGPVVYVVPGSPLVGELAVRGIVDSAAEVEIIPAESFVDAVLAEMGYDPLDRGLQILNGHSLPDPLVLDKPTIVAQVDRPEILADVAAAIDAIVPDGTMITVLSGLGSKDSRVASMEPAAVDPALGGYRTSLFIDAEPGGLIGVVQTMRRLRDECPWDREQTHQTLVKNLVEEVYELIAAIGNLPSQGTDWVAYAAVEDELGDVLLQVLFHEAIGREAGALDINSVSEVLRQKLVRRHPHVFADVEAGSAEEVKVNWDRIKSEERGTSPESALDGIPEGMPALHRSAKIQNRAAKIGFDWDTASQVIPKIREELDEVEAAVGDAAATEDEIGDLLFSVINLARHLGVDPELALRASTRSFEERLRLMEAEGPLDGLTIDELNERWERAKRKT